MLLTKEELFGEVVLIGGFLLILFTTQIQKPSCSKEAGDATVEWL